MSDNVEEQSVIDQMLEQADQFMEQDQFEQAMEILQNALGRPEFDLRIYEKSAFALRMLGRHEGADLFENVLVNAEDPEALYKLGHELLQAGMTRAALGPLHRCINLAPDVATVNYEFGYALMKEFFNEEALYYFHQAAEKEEIIGAHFFMGQLLIFLDRADEAFTFVQGLENVAKENSDVQMQADYLKGMYRRYRTYNPSDIRDWQFIQYGTMLLRMFQEDYPDTDHNPSKGRYTVVNFSEQAVMNVMAALQTLVGTLPVFPKYSYVAFAGPDSAVLAHLLGSMMQLPVKPLSDIGAPEEASATQGIVLCSGSDELDGVEGDVWGRGDILLFNFWHSWTRESNVLPDVIGYFAQVARFPWQERYERTETGEVGQLPADTRTPEEIAAELLQKVPYADMEWVGRLHDYFKSRTDHLQVGTQADIPRKKFFVHSALGGDRF